MKSVFNIPQDPHLWHRAFARLFDTYIVGGLLLILFGSILAAKNTSFYFECSAFFDDHEPFILIPIFILFSCVEPFFLFFFQTTPGKYLFGLQAHDEAGDSLSLLQAFKRSMYVLILGCGVGIPLIHYICGLWNFVHTKKNGKTFYDKHLDVIISYTVPGLFRRGLSLCAIITVMAFHFILSGAHFTPEKPESYFSPEEDFSVISKGTVHTSEDHFGWSSKTLSAYQVIFIWRPYNYNQVQRILLPQNMEFGEFESFTKDWIAKTISSDFVIENFDYGKSATNDFMIHYSLKNKSYNLVTKGFALLHGQNILYFVQGTRLQQLETQINSFLNSFKLRTND